MKPKRYWVKNLKLLIEKLIYKLMGLKIPEDCRLKEYKKIIVMNLKKHE